MRKREREITDIKEIESIISHADVCRIALANNDVPYIVTMNFGYKRGEKPELFFHCANEGRKLDMIRKNNYICFEMDTGHNILKSDKPCEYAMKYSSVVGYGYVFIVKGKDEKKEGLNYIMSHYSEDSKFYYNENTLERTTVLRLEITEMTGKQI
jgi:nitroimidazol reductase NimA-like FMN-containing flavoprotein (pyridoxamine 5'-phosphate oxidase superfamily)